MKQSLHCLGIITGFLFTHIVFAADENEWLDMNFEDLMQIEVTSVNRYSESIMNSAAAIHVINANDIKRSGATSIPEALRMAPGMYVAQLDGGRWVVGTRSFPGRFANKLLVMIDGRSVYTHAFSGVFWEAINVMMEDIERIEVIRGPGATLWGANAVNGVINIITKSSQDTQGTLVTVTTGNNKTISSARYGQAINDNTHARGYVKYEAIDNQIRLDSQTASNDASHHRQAGFRVDTSSAKHGNFRLQGDVYSLNRGLETSFGSLLSATRLVQNENADYNGFNVMANWSKPLSITTAQSFQTYINHDKVHEASLNRFTLTEFDADYQLHHSLNDRHDIIVGAGYRANKLHMTTETNHINAVDRSIFHQRFSGFIQDKITLIEDTLDVTVGSKFEHNSYTGFEYQPNVRFLWKRSDNESIWGSISRSVRTPSYIEEYGVITNVDPAGTRPGQILPLETIINFAESDFDSETHMSYELGHRKQLTGSLSIDSTVFFSKYTDLRDASTQPPQIVFPGPYLRVPTMVTNDANATVHGAEVSSKWQATNKLLVHFDYSYSKLDINTKEGSLITENAANNTPQQRFSLRTMYDIRDDIQFDAWLRYTDKVTSDVIFSTNAIEIDDIWTLDLRLNWQATDKLSVAMGGKNLLDNRNLENFDDFFNQQQVEITRSFYATINYQF